MILQTMWFSVVSPDVMECEEILDGTRQRQRVDFCELVGGKALVDSDTAQILKAQWIAFHRSKIIAKFRVTQ